MSYQTPPGGTPYTIPNSNLALVSLITGILGLTIFPLAGSIVAVITGSMAKKEIAESGGTIGGESLATIGTVLGWVGIALGILGFCLFGAILAIPLCLVPWGVIRDGSSWLAPALLTL